MMGQPRVIVLIVILGAALVAIETKPQDQGARGRQSGWYSSRSRERSRTPYNQPNNPDVDDDEPSFGTRDDYGSKDPTYGRRARPDGVSRSNVRTTVDGDGRRARPDGVSQPFDGRRARPAGSRRQGAYNRNQPPHPGWPQTPPDTPRQPVFGGYDPRPQPDYEPRPQPVYEPRPQPVYEPRPQPVYEPRQPVYDPRPQPPPDTPRQPVDGGYDPRPQPDYDPRPQPPYEPRPQPGYDPRPQPPPDTPRRPVFGGYDPKPPQYPTDTWQRPPAPQPERPSDDLLQVRTDDRRPSGDMLNLIPGGRYQGPGNLGGSGPKDFVIGDEGVLCAPTCRGHCIIRDTECNCVQNMTCFNEYRHRLDIPAPDILYQPPDCRAMECTDECGYKVQWPDGWCMCEIDPNCAARPASNAYTKREADLDKLISQREAHMDELRRASRHSKMTKRDADMGTETIN